MRDLSAADYRQHQSNELGEEYGGPARDIAPGERWAFADHRTMAEVIIDEAQLCAS